jgi:predicted RND superfamily exporter protein
MSALTTVASFGNLAFSSHLGMASMGQLLTLGMAMSVVAILGLLPALMRYVRVT